jgi:hypothetical protein
MPAARADLVLSATPVPVTVTVFVAVTVGAVNSPVVLTVPEVADQEADVPPESYQRAQGFFRHAQY